MSDGCFLCGQAGAKARILREYGGSAQGSIFYGRHPTGMLCDDCFAAVLGGKILALPFEDMRASTEEWVLRNGSAIANSDRSALAQEWPLPVGFEVLNYWRRNRLGRRDHGMALSQDLDPLGDVSEGFPPYAYIGLALHRHMRTGDIWLFGTVAPADPFTDDAWIFAAPITRCIVWPSGVRTMRGIERELRAEYARAMQGTQFSVGGRLPGARQVREDGAEFEAYVEAVRNHWKPARQRGNWQAVASAMSAVLDYPVTAGEVRKRVERGAWSGPEAVLNGRTTK